jgi:hypothetical protein
MAEMGQFKQIQIEKRTTISKSKLNQQVMVVQTIFTGQ